jgi:hypothetical protein
MRLYPATFILVPVTMMLIRQASLLTSFPRSVDSQLDLLATLPFRSRLPPELHYGVEMACLFPAELTIDNGVRPRKMNLLKEMAATLQEAGVPASFFEHKSTVSIDQWKLALERTGFEVASPLSLPFEHVERFVKVMKDFSCLGPSEIYLDAH